MASPLKRDACRAPGKNYIEFPRSGSVAQFSLVLFILSLLQVCLLTRGRLELWWVFAQWQTGFRGHAAASPPVPRDHGAGLPQLTFLCCS